MKNVIIISPVSTFTYWGLINFHAPRNREKEDEMDSMTNRLNRQLADVEFQKSTLERQKAALESELEAARQEVSGLKSTVAVLSSARAGIEAELSATKVPLNIGHEW